MYRSLTTLAKWAFGLDGLRNLRFLVWGNFGFHGRWSSSPKWIASRNADYRGEGFDESCQTARDPCLVRLVSEKGDVGLRELVNTHEDFFTACSKDYLMDDD